MKTITIEGVEYYVLKRSPVPTDPSAILRGRQATMRRRGIAADLVLQQPGGERLYGALEHDDGTVEIRTSLS